MSLRRTFAITGRLMRQFRHDRRTLAILFVTPLLVLALFAALFRTDAPVPSVVVTADDAPIAQAIATALRNASEIQAVEGGGDASITIPAPDADGVLRPDLTFLDSDQRIPPIVTGALQRAILAAATSGLASLPPGAPRPPAVEPVIHPFYGDATLDALDLLGGPFIGLLVFLLVYVVTSVSFLRERSAGTLERLMASPLRRTEIVVGYMIGFTIVALVQAAEVLGFGLLVLGLSNAGSVVLIFGLEVLLAIGAVSLGIFLSTFARTEFEAVQFIPLVVVPQVLLSGLLVPVSAEPGWLQVISNVLPLTYAVDALREVMLRGAGLDSAVVLRDVAVLAGFCVLVIVAASATLRREVA
jgi:ABC-2 type transport system permease protein